MFSSTLLSNRNKEIPPSLRGNVQRHDLGGCNRTLALSEDFHYTKSFTTFFPGTGEQRQETKMTSFKPFNIVLIEPEIPPNTGNIARLCGATCSTLHLVGKLGFSTDDKTLKRAGLDYWKEVEIKYWHTLDEIKQANPGGRYFYTSKKADKAYVEVNFKEGDFLVFGKETAGLPEQLLQENPETSIRIPIFGNVRSINLATATGIVLYEALRQTGRLSETSQTNQVQTPP